MGRDYWYCFGIPLTLDEHSLLKKVSEEELKEGFGGQEPFLLRSFACVSFWLDGIRHGDVIPLQNVKHALECLSKARLQWHLSSEPVFVFMINDSLNPDEMVVVGQAYKLDSPRQILSLGDARRHFIPAEPFPRRVRIRGDQRGIKYDYKGAFKCKDFGVYFGIEQDTDHGQQFYQATLLRVVRNNMQAVGFIEMLEDLYTTLPELAHFLTGSYDPTRVKMILWNTDASLDRFEWPIYDRMALARELALVTPFKEVELDSIEQQALKELEKDIDLSISPDPEAALNAGYKFSSRHVVELHLKHLDLQNVPRAIDKFPALQALDLSDNRLSKIPSWIDNLTILKELYLQQNQIKFLPESIGKLTQLKTISVLKNQLSTLPMSFGEMVSLQEIRAYKNKLKSLPESFGNLGELITLELEENQIQSLPETFGKLNNLKSLNLRGNLLKELPDSFGNLVHLEFVDLYFNQLHKIPESIGNIRELRHFDLGSNKLLQLPDSICQLEKLENLNLSQNKLKELPIYFGNLTALHILDLLGNPISKLPDSFKNLINLNELNLYGTGCSTIPQVAKSLPNITKIDTMEERFRSPRKSK